MNSILARIYGTGMDKTASEHVDAELDLDNISAATLLAGLEDGSIVLEDDEDFEKEAGAEDIDLSQLTGEELLQLAEELDATETEDDQVINKMASDGSFATFDMAGRIMAHAYHDEMQKLAAEAELPEFIDPAEIDAETLIDLVESGEYEVVDMAEPEMQKEAGFFKTLGRAFTGKDVRKSGKALKRAKRNRDMANKGFEASKKRIIKENQGIKAKLKAKPEGNTTPLLPEQIEQLKKRKAENEQLIAAGDKIRGGFDSAVSKAKKERRKARLRMAGAYGGAATLAAGGAAAAQASRNNQG